ncbi:class I lanthipeptide [Hymenobacter cellulosivorans]|uniref:Class I lanthipeptide n=1 Tax=Hymenobacter cellulosivorans TaxID=2932249 RepID=A0ABY4F6S9_9BACT|nr:class I lanthipeptide [Hymenobacter cellulosivorans]UOQ52371.1 class I lanthipeptide [Hymenobacter cellulosivorans]UOQ52372.1 class I lanthipeptide [Hymenobacter cellulosivorans]
MKNKKLSLNKKAVTKLSNEQMKAVAGGFTSIFHCSAGGFTCADTCTSNATNTCHIEVAV